MVAFPARVRAVPADCVRPAAAAGLGGIRRVPGRRHPDGGLDVHRGARRRGFGSRRRVASVHAFVAFRPSQEEVPNGTRASELALATARARLHHRQQARELAAANPVLAAELKIGRPDLPHDYDDGGLVDVNHVPAGVLASCLGLTPAESQEVVAARGQISRFSSPEELSAYTDLPPDRVEALRDWILFG
jgi:hypothetical protein